MRLKLNDSRNSKMNESLNSTKLSGTKSTKNLLTQSIEFSKVDNTNNKLDRMSNNYSSATGIKTARKTPSGATFKSNIKFSSRLKGGEKSFESSPRSHDSSKLFEFSSHKITTRGVNGQSLPNG